MEYSVIEGKELNSKNYESEGFRYVKARECEGSIYTIKTQLKYICVYTLTYQSIRTDPNFLSHFLTSIYLLKKVHTK